MDEKIVKLQELIDGHDNIVFFGGAGVSTESGIPDFRSQDGLYHQKYDFPPETILSHSFFLSHPDEFYKFYRDKMLCDTAKPNAAHLKLAELEKAGKLKAVITQNIDNLHQMAGSQKVLELHGSVYRNHCMRCGKSFDFAHMKHSTGVPRCECGGMIKPDVVLYEEALNEQVMDGAVQAIAAGIALVRAQKQNGAQLLATGEMGIGNTTTSSAVASVLLGRPVAEMTGRGAGLSDAGLHRKIDAIERGIARNHPDAADPLGVLAALGGFDIAGLCGVFLGGALERLPIVMDGFISGVAALCAVRLCPAAEKAVFASHVSSEPAAHIVLDALCKKPLITAELHLGEGTGAVASLPLWDMALAVYNGCYSFAEGGITPYTPQC